MNNSALNPLPLIVAPSAMEYSVVQKAVQNSRNRGKFTLMTCGVGEGQARSFCRVIEDLPVSCLVLVGWAGGLTTDMAAGVAVWADAALYEGQPQLSCQVPSFKDIRTGPILTVPKALLTPQEKRSAQDSGAIAVEMEAYPLAAWAAQRGIPFMHGRVILDTLDESIPNIGQGINPSGSVRLVSFIKYMLRHPKLFGDLWRLNKRVRLVNPALEKMVRDVLEAF